MDRRSPITWTTADEVRFDAAPGERKSGSTNTILAPNRPKKFGVTVRAGGEAKVKDADGNPIVLKRGVTIDRWTFVIGKDGKVIYKNPKVAAAQDSKQILEVIEKQSQ